MLKKIAWSFFLPLLFAASAFGQTVPIEGIVVDERTGEPLPGVTVYIGELQRGAATGLDGTFRVDNVPHGTYTVRISSVGYRTLHREIETADPPESVTFRLQEDLVGLDAVVVTGQGSGVSRHRLSTNVTTISARQIGRIPANRLDQVLQGNLTNAQVRLTSGQPGTASHIRGRGVVSALHSTTPVIYVDGVRVDNTTRFQLDEPTGGAESSALADIPIEDIERIEVVSGGAATTQFGSDAANGVIQIFTRRGVEGASRFSFESSLGSSRATRDFLRFDRTGDILFSPGLHQEYRLSASGGSRDFNYSFSGSMRGDDGVLANNSELRHNLRAAFGARLSDIVRYNSSTSFTSLEFGRDWNGNFAGNPFDMEIGSFGNPEEWDLQEFEERREMIRNYVELSDISENVTRFQTSQRLDFDLRQNLTAAAVLGLDSRNSGQNLYETNAYLIARGFANEGTTDQGVLIETDRNFLGVTLEASARHEAEVNDFSFVTNVGGQLFRNDERQLRVRSDGLPDGSQLAVTGSSTIGRNFRRTLVNYGVYALENVGFRDRYFVEFGLRADRNTAFGEEVGWQLYPKVGLVYNLSSEPFFQSAVSPDILSTLRLRANLGWSGNFPSPFSNQVLASVDAFRGSPTLEFGAAGDINLRPERTRTLEFGGDIAFVNDRFNLEFTYYESETTDALFRAPFARSTGLGTTIRNLGTIRNSGIELAGRFHLIRTAESNVSLRGSVNTLDNEVVDNGDSAPFALGGFGFLGSWVDEGFPVGYFRGDRATFDENGSVVDVVINDDLGSPLPDVFGSIGLNADYRNFSLTVTADYQFGAQGVWMDEVLRFSAGMQDGRIPQQAIDERGLDFFTFAASWVEDTDYLKVRLIALDYTLPERVHGGLVRRIALGVSALNPFNVTSSNFDPEVSGAGVARDQGGIGVGGFAYRTLSPPRQFTGRIRIDF